MDPKTLYQEANRLYVQAKGILEEFDGKEMPAEKQAQVDQLLDQVEAKTAEAKRLERVAQMGAAMNEPTNRLGAGATGTDSAKANEGNIEAKAAFEAYLRKGQMGMSGAEVKALSASEDEAGGYLVPDTFRNELLEKQKEQMAMRRIARVLPSIAGGSTISPAVDEDLSDPTWTSELDTGDEDEVKPFGRRVLTPHPLAKRIKTSRTLLRAANFNVESWVAGQLGYKFSLAEEAAFINGDGNNKPLGLLNTPSLPTLTTAGSNVIAGDDLINWVYKLGARYANNARILCNRSFIRKVRQLKDSQNQYLWQPGLQAGMPGRILDTPYDFSDQFPTGLDGNDAFADNAVVAVIGDFKFYWIVDSLALSVQRLNELYAEKNQVGHIGRKETDGQAVLAEAFHALKIKA